MQEEIIIVKRNNYNQHLRTFGKPLLKIERANCRFILSQIGADYIGVKEDDGVMFSINKTKGEIFISQDKEEDAFILKRKDTHTLRFTSKDLFSYFDEVFKLKETKLMSFIFDIIKVEPNKFLIKSRDI